MSSAAEKKPLTSDDAERGAPALARTKFRLENVCCEGETRLAKRTLADVPGVADVKVNVVGRVAYVSHHTDVITSAEICDKLNGVNLGASVEAAAASVDAALDPPDYKTLGFLALLAGAFAAGLAMGSERALLGVVALGCLPLFRDAAGAAAGGRLDVNVLMLVAVAGALALGDVADAATVCVVASAAKAAEHDCMRRVRNALAEVACGDGKDAARRPDGSSVDADELVAGDVVVVRAGERVPVDGVVTKGKAAVDESSLTGESAPVQKAKGDAVSRGTVATQGFVEVACSRARNADGAAEMARLVAEAQASTTRSQDLIGNFAAVFTPLVLAAAMSAGVLVSARVGLVLLVLACPCALVLAAPIVVVSSLGAAAKRGIVVKSAAALEALAAVDLACADKTGTLTQGRCRVVRRVDAPGVAKLDADRMLRLAASLEARTAHPLAAAVVNEAAGGCVGDDAAASALSDDVKRVDVVPGAGVAGDVAGCHVRVGTADHCEVGPDQGWAPPPRGGATTLFVDVDDEVGLALSVLDPVRAEAPGALAALRALGLGLAVLTGDRREVVDAVLAEIGTLAGGLGDVDVRAACKPADKLAYVRAARAKRRVVLFVGDGINDAPALAAADVGVAMGAGGTAMAVDAADVAIMTDDLACLPAAVALGQAATAAIGQNVVLSVAFKLAVVAAAFAYDVPLWVAVSADLASLLAVVANGSRPMWARG